MNIKNLTKHCFAKINAHFLSVLIIAIIAFFVTYSNLGLTKEFVGDDASVGYHFPNTRMEMVSNMWNSHIFPGKSDTIGTTSLIHIISINALSKLGFSPILIDRLYYFLFFFVSGTGMYFLSFHICSALSAIGKKNLWSIPLVGAVFYMLNNFTMILLSFPPTSYAYSYIFLPWIFFLYLKDFHISSDLWRKLVFATIVILLLSGNPSNTISIIFLLLIYELFFRKKGKIFDNFKRFIHTLLLILLMSSFIYLPVLGNRSNPYGDVLSSDNRASISFSSSTTSIENLLVLRGHHSQDTFVFNEFLLDNITIVLSYVLIIFVVASFLRRKKNKMELFLFLSFIIFLFLAKAEHAPFEWLNRLIYDNVPLFEMYRASYFKFVYYCVFAISILIPISLLKISNEFFKSHLRLTKKIVLTCSFLLILFCAKPFFWGEVARDIHKTTIPDEYHDLRAYFSNIKTDFSVLSIPQLSSGLVLDWGNGNYYGGGHPDMFMLDKPVWSNSWFLPENKMSDQFDFYKNVLYRSNMKYVLLHKDIPEKYSFDINMAGVINGQTNFNTLNDQLVSDKNFKLIQDNNFFKIFEINQREFNSHFYTPTVTSLSKRKIEELSKIVSDLDWEIRSAVFFENQNEGKRKVLGELKNISEKNEIATSLDAPRNDPKVADGDGASTPILEFKKINPTKYRVRVHSASGKFPLVFSESFHEGWRAYLAKPDNFQFSVFNFQTISNDLISKYKILDGNDEDPNHKSGISDGVNQALAKYKILDGNQEDQASKEELADFVKKGWVSTFGDPSDFSSRKLEGAGGAREIRHMKWVDGKEVLDYVEKYNIDFISKNFQGTIQNDNLPSGNIFETWFKKPLDGGNHLMVNGYANSWIINTEEICNNNPSYKVQGYKVESDGAVCVRNADGSYDMEIIVEFWPQRLFYVGLGISGITLLCCVGYLGFDYYRRKKSKRQATAI